MFAAEHSRTVAEKSKRYSQFFREIEGQRKFLMESHEKEADIKNGKIRQQLEAEVERVIEETSEMHNQLKEFEDKAAKLAEEVSNHEEQLQRYRNSDLYRLIFPVAIIEQLRLLSPTSLGSRLNLSMAPESAQPRPASHTFFSFLFSLPISRILPSLSWHVSLCPLLSDFNTPAIPSAPSGIDSPINVLILGRPSRMIATGQYPAGAYLMRDVYQSRSKDQSDPDPLPYLDSSPLFLLTTPDTHIHHIIAFTRNLPNSSLRKKNKGASWVRRTSLYSLCSSHSINPLIIVIANVVLCLFLNVALCPNSEISGLPSIGTGTSGGTMGSVDKHDQGASSGNERCFDNPTEERTETLNLTSKYSSWSEETPGGHIRDGKPTHNYQNRQKPGKQAPPEDGIEKSASPDISKSDRGRIKGNHHHLPRSRSRGAIFLNTFAADHALLHDDRNYGGLAISRGNLPKDISTSNIADIRLDASEKEEKVKECEVKQVTLVKQGAPADSRGPLSQPGFLHAEDSTRLPLVIRSRCNGIRNENGTSRQRETENAPNFDFKDHSRLSMPNMTHRKDAEPINQIGLFKNDCPSKQLESGNPKCSSSLHLSRQSELKKSNDEDLQHQQRAAVVTHYIDFDEYSHLGPEGRESPERLKLLEGSTTGLVNALVLVDQVKLNGCPHKSSSQEQDSHLGYSNDGSVAVEAIERLNENNSVAIAPNLGENSRPSPDFLSNSGLHIHVNDHYQEVVAHMTLTVGFCMLVPFGQDREAFKKAAYDRACEKFKKLAEEIGTEKMIKDWSFEERIRYE
ncbi:uncharacterized protein BDR25DRAFT_362598 [Lindgomyces ingoldianus]|uniref:Uncharacterized protein n=1 Tax=Lindgomyces ingoldianus TaxID=673940 RepID=A0ACB6Q9L1_9PLEO|nr:uncharacterized protein BDR25DRAFT_362598 [Lindgomyces ingoldianus]KAF2463599.1 hypothetical protein BDR25DRAFT_362598 [Lindgomyces ingoldianus]